MIYFYKGYKKNVCFENSLKTRLNIIPANFFSRVVVPLLNIVV